MLFDSIGKSVLLTDLQLDHVTGLFRARGIELLPGIILLAYNLIFWSTLNLGALVFRDILCFSGAVNIHRCPVPSP
jgi:hypothetical protein